MTSGTGLARYSGTHFVKWDNWKMGGRWFECTIIKQMSNGKYQVMEEIVDFLLKKGTRYLFMMEPLATSTARI